MNDMMVPFKWATDCLIEASLQDSAPAAPKYPHEIEFFGRF